MRVGDVLHEFSDIPGVREDVIQVTLQVKQIRLKLEGVDSTRMHLEVRGEGTVTAADIVTPAEVEIVNPELYLFTVDSPKTKLDIVRRRRRVRRIEHGSRMPIVASVDASQPGWRQLEVTSAGSTEHEFR
jgi:DNA-directed RNA polymerase subunit alpha